MALRCLHPPKKKKGDRNWEMELSTTAELDQVIADGHAVVLFYGDYCRACNNFFPVWEECRDKLTFLNPKWRFYSMQEDKAVPLLNRLRIQTIPKVVIFECPAAKTHVDGGMLVTTEQGLQRLAYPLTLPTLREAGPALGVMQPFLTLKCECSVPKQYGSSSSRVAMLSKSHSSSGGVGGDGGVQESQSVQLIREALQVGNVLGDQLFDWLRDTVVFAEDPVHYWRTREKKQLVAN